MGRNIEGSFEERKLDPQDLFGIHVHEEHAVALEREQVLQQLAPGIW
jgi:hypothetical protein